jgi:ergothioneine biosynthesis protein EgtB
MSIPRHSPAALPAAHPAPTPPSRPLPAAPAVPAATVAPVATPTPAAPGTPLLEAFVHNRGTTLALCEPLETEDYGLQSMPDASPVKWHLAHTSWFYEEFLLREHAPDYLPFHPAFRELFNSYYQSVGAPFARPDRGKLSRPTVGEVMHYRAHVERAVTRLLVRHEAGPSPADAVASIVALGIAHEQQHQELLLTDLKHAFSLNPLRPVYRARERSESRAAPGTPRFHRVAGGLSPIGHGSREFAFDNETPRHRAFLEPFQLADRLVTNAEYRQFVHDGGYRQPTLWLADGWDLLQREGWTRPLYWSADCASEFTLGGERALEPTTPVAHLSFYEAEAFARWAQARLPTEQEWEVAASMLPVEGNFLEAGRWHPAPTGVGRPTPPPRIQQMFGDVWEWTRSAYAPYAGYRPLPGAVGEYNGKFMSGQMVLRGGSCATPGASMRATYRNFFPPSARWQFAGLRLARDG